MASLSIWRKPTEILTLQGSMPLSRIEQALLLAAYCRGGRSGGVWVANSDQIVTLSLFYTGDLTARECSERLSTRAYVGALYDEEGELRPEIAARYDVLVKLIRDCPELIEGGGDFTTPSLPSYTACGLTAEGERSALAGAAAFPRQPVFPEWPDKRSADVT